ncbi:uncharacterized protein LOC144477828 [Augochlora pura]
MLESSKMMDVFQTYYRVYYSVLCFIGLWPYHKSYKLKILRIFILLILTSSIAIQLSSLKRVDPTLDNILRSLSFTFPVLMFIVRYIGFVNNFSIVKCFMQNLQQDYSMLENPYEVEILIKNIEKSKRVINVFFGKNTRRRIF